MLTEGGYQVTPCANGQDALNTLQDLAERDEMPSLIVTDLNLPDVSGLSVISAARQINQHQPVVVVTGWLKDQLLERILEQSHISVLKKPFTAPRLLDWVSANLFPKVA